jgi:hypothetical protein
MRKTFIHPDIGIIDVRKIIRFSYPVKGVDGIYRFTISTIAGTQYDCTFGCKEDADSSINELYNEWCQYE